MAVSQVAVPKVVTGTTLTTAYTAGYTPTLGDLLLIVCEANNAAGTTPTFSSPSGWTLIGQVSGSNGLQRLAAHVLARNADGTSGDNAPVITVTSGSSGQALTEAWSGLDLTSLPLQPTAPFTGSAVTTASVTGNSITTSVANEWIYSTFTARLASSATSTLWTGGNTVDLADTVTGTIHLASGYQTAGASGSVVTSSGSVSSTSGAISSIMSFGFAPLTSATLPFSPRVVLQAVNRSASF